MALCSDQGILLGHFVTYVAPPGIGSASNVKCDTSGSESDGNSNYSSPLAICTAVLIK